MKNSLVKIDEFTGGAPIPPVNTREAGLFIPKRAGVVHPPASKKKTRRGLFWKASATGGGKTGSPHKASSSYALA
ncbi:MAG TPA: hypothetical protein DDW94_06110 [Deltaproteobacteria bacterium]|nr:MAG: hypothetical protein A2Z79_00640 [Deltaproteobacteria bacterium GWA2_55_82]OGQ64885.1 MAG: hypothetical protein A3I81_04750 [Deltaproteobacteria bacterium RIFCSPLOWO2_02_FULL_55_12]OIJ73952.1 MAG: hypothetical protein A2V21_306545 [Deltaproteobacteria bacterium GWC2_55_46]HBG46550.1 hypothetical protein [Deltaproteobacteria bacterium]HCY09952.1 hypothetical protein [Deltaproteobacteria bacterium]